MPTIIPTFTPGAAPTQQQLDWWMFSRPMMQAVATSGKSAVNVTNTTIPMDSVLIDRATGMNLVTGVYSLGSVFGYYWVEGLVNFGTSTAGFIRKPMILGQFTSVTSYTNANMTVRPYSGITASTGRLLVNATTSTDNVSLGVYQDSGGTITVSFAAFYVEYAGN
jgi:hypothetical protein